MAKKKSEDFTPEKKSRLPIIIGAAIVIVAVIGFWWFSSQSKHSSVTDSGNVKITNNKATGASSQSSKSPSSSSSSNVANSSMMTQDSSAPKSINDTTKKATDIVNQSLGNFFEALYSVSATSKAADVVKAKGIMNKYAADAKITDGLLKGAGAQSSAKTQIETQQTGNITAAVSGETGGNVTLQVVVPFESGGNDSSAWFTVVTSADGSKIISCQYNGTVQRQGN